MYEEFPRDHVYPRDGDHGGVDMEPIGVGGSVKRMLVGDRLIACVKVLNARVHVSVHVRVCLLTVAAHACVGMRHGLYPGAC